MTERLARDIFPAEVSDGENVHTVARVFVTSHRVIVWTAPMVEAGKPIEFRLREPGSVQASHNTLVAPLRMETETGELHVNRIRGHCCDDRARLLKTLPKPV